MFGLFTKKLASHDTSASETELLKVFRSNPGQFLHQFGSNEYVWPGSPNNLPDMYFTSSGFAFGYIHRISFIEPSTVIVHHFAIGEKGLERTGLGTILAYWLRNELKNRYQIEDIIFSETSLREQDSAFFTKLGAVHTGTVDYCDQYRWRLGNL